MRRCNRGIGYGNNSDFHGSSGSCHFSRRSKSKSPKYCRKKKRVKKVQNVEQTLLSDLLIGGRAIPEIINSEILEQNYPSPFYKIPNELVFKILQYCEEFTIPNLKICSKRYYHLISSRLVQEYLTENIHGFNITKRILNTKFSFPDPFSLIKSQRDCKIMKRLRYVTANRKIFFLIVNNKSLIDSKVFFPRNFISRMKVKKTSQLSDFRFSDSTKDVTTRRKLTPSKLFEGLIAYENSKYTLTSSSRFDLVYGKKHVYEVSFPFVRGRLFFSFKNKKMNIRSCNLVFDLDSYSVDMKCEYFHSYVKMGF